MNIDIRQLVSELEVPSQDSSLCRWCWTDSYKKESSYCGSKCFLESKEFRDRLNKRLWTFQEPS